MGPMWGMVGFVDGRSFAGVLGAGDGLQAGGERGMVWRGGGDTLIRESSHVRCEQRIDIHLRHFCRRCS